MLIRQTRPIRAKVSRTNLNDLLANLSALGRPERIGQVWKIRASKSALCKPE